MKLYVVFEMSTHKDIMAAVFLDHTDAYQFAKTDLGIRYVVPIPATEETINDWYKFKEKSDQVLDNTTDRPYM
jgi:hypothetical protein